MSDNDGLPIELDELTLRRVEQTDSEDLLEIYSDPDVARYQFFDPLNSEYIEKQIRYQAEIIVGDPGVPFFLVIVLRSENKVIGDVQISINSIEDQQGEIGFSLNPKYTGRGFATRAVNATLGYGFNHLNLHRIRNATHSFRRWFPTSQTWTRSRHSLT